MLKPPYVLKTNGYKTKIKKVLRFLVSYDRTETVAGLVLTEV